MSNPFLLAELYIGWNGATLTQEKLNEIDKSIRNFPVEALQKKLKNLNFSKLRKMLFQLDLHAEFMKILASKYNLKHGSNDIISENLGIQILNTEKNKISDNICQKSDSSCQYSECKLITEIFHEQTNTCNKNQLTDTTGCTDHF